MCHFYDIQFWYVGLDISNQEANITIMCMIKGEKVRLTYNIFRAYRNYHSEPTAKININALIFACIYLRNGFQFSEVYRELHWVACKVNELRRGACKLCWRRNVVYTSISNRNIKFIAYVYIRFNQNPGEKILYKH